MRLQGVLSLLLDGKCESSCANFCPLDRSFPLSLECLRMMKWLRVYTHTHMGGREVHGGI